MLSQPSVKGQYKGSIKNTATYHLAKIQSSNMSSVKNSSFHIGNSHFDYLFAEIESIIRKLRQELIIIDIDRYSLYFL